MHGMNRRASLARDNWELAADRYGLLVLAPEFSGKFWAGSRYYNLGAVAEEDNREKWAYSAIEHLFDEVRDGQRTYDIFGHSAGAQFVHRLLVLLPDSRASVVMAANAGWYMMPEWRRDKAGHPYPHSLVGSPVGEKELRTALQRKMHVILGEEDTDPQHRSLDNSEASQAQGANRVARGERFVATATAAANALGVKLAWELTYVPGAGHNSTSMSRAAADLVYGAKK
jgi:poly(3-hydroxybutyrate) depolymerase